MSRLSSYKSKTPEFQKLEEGDQIVRLASYKETDSFHNYDGTMKDPLPDYSNPTEQLVITVVSTSGKGALTHRLNLDGFVRFSELTEKEVRSGKFEDVLGYACAKDPKTKELVRLTDEARTRTCEGILDQMFAAMNVSEGSGIEALDEAIADKAEFVVRVTREEYEGKDQYRIGAFKKVSAMKEVTSDLES